MNLISAAIHNPVKVAVGVILVVVFGIVGLLRMPIQLAPEVEIPRVTVETRWQGASPVEVEREIVDEQEEQLNTAEGLRKLESESSDSAARIVLEFPVGSDIDATMLLVSNRLNQVKEYPANADRPVISKSDSVNNRPIAWFMLRPLPEFADKINIEQERTFAENEVEPELEKVPGVSAANTFGGWEKRLEVIIDPQQLAARQINIAQLRDALVAQNKDTSGGDFWEGKRRYVLRTLGQFRSPEQVENVIIDRRGGQPVYVRDVATVRLGYKKPDSVVRQKGQTTIAINVLRSTGSNVLEVMAGVQESVKAMNNGMLKDRGLALEQVYDETEYIVGAISLVESNIIIGSVLTVLVLLIYLRNLSPTIVIALSIPCSIIGTFCLFSALGRTLNVISLAGMSFAVGMVVDNAIVVMENIYRHFEMNKSRVQAALDGTKEVWGAVVASTLTTLAVFVPVVFVQEEAGQLFRDISIAISCAVGLSLLVSVTVIPPAAARILRRRPSRQTKPSRLGRMFDGFGNLFVDSIVGLNRFIQRSVLTRMAAVAASVVIAVYGSVLLWPSVEYLPEGNRNLIIGLLLPPPGYNVDEMIEIGKKVEKRLEPYWEANSPACLERGVPSIEHFFFVARGRQLFMGAKANDPERAAELIPLLREGVGDIPGMIPVVLQTSLFEGALEGGRSIDIEITGDQLPKLVALGGQVFGKVMAMSMDPTSPLFQSQPRPIPGLDIANPEVHVKPKWDQSADLGITARELGYAVDALIDGAYSGDYYDKNDKIDLEIVGDDQFANRTDQLEQLYLAAEGGQLVPLSTVADVELGVGPEQVNHRQRRRAIVVQVKPPASTPLDMARQILEKEVLEPVRASGQLEGGRYRIDIGGTADKLTEAWSALWFNLLLALVITYLLMAGLFESFWYPFVIILSVPFGAVGGFAFLFITSMATQYYFDRVTSLDILTMLGFVILIGTVVNNPILIVHQALNLIREEMTEFKRLAGSMGEETPDLAEHEAKTARVAVIEATRTRIRPIFMTTTTTVLGLLPLVVMPGSGSEIYRGLGSVVLGGLIVSTLGTLILVPALFTLALDVQKTFKNLLGRRTSVSLDETYGADEEEDLGTPVSVATNGNGHEPHSPAEKTSHSKPGE